MDGPRIVLVTGFGAFPGARSNPTLDILRRLAGSRRWERLGVRLVTATLPVTWAGIEAALHAQIALSKPDAILHLGLASRRKGLSVETRAVNRLSKLKPDAARQASRIAAIAGGPGLRQARWNDARLVAAITAGGAPVQRSIDAGDYLCNLALYLTLGMTPAPTGFLHVPKPRAGSPVASSPVASSPVACGPRPHMRPDIQQMARAAEHAVLELLAMHRTRPTPRA